MALPLIQLSGTPYEQGLQHGKALKEQIGRNLDVYFHRFTHDSRLDRPEVLRRAHLYAPRIAKQNAAYFEGMKGIATGCGRSLDEIVALNVRYEIIYYQSVVHAMEKLEGCTAFAIDPRASANGHLLLGQNWDWIPGVLGVVLHSMESDGMHTLAFSEAGIFGGKIGMNSAGLGLAVNGLTSTADNWRYLRKPFHVRCYEILHQQDVDSAVAVLTESRRSCSANFLIAQTPNCVANVETAPESTELSGCASGFTVHTNHFLNPAKMGIVEPPSERRVFSQRRCQRMEALLKSDAKVTIDDLKHHLTNHDDAPVSICRHEDPSAPVADQFRTVTSIVMDLHQKTMEITDGPPCESRYATVSLD